MRIFEANGPKFTERRTKEVTLETAAAQRGTEKVGDEKNLSVFSRVDIPHIHIFDLIRVRRAGSARFNTRAKAEFTPHVIFQNETVVHYFLYEDSRDI